MNLKKSIWEGLETGKGNDVIILKPQKYKKLKEECNSFG